LERDAGALHGRTAIPPDEPAGRFGPPIEWIFTILAMALGAIVLVRALAG
jgi:hypothetical protein